MSKHPFDEWWESQDNPVRTLPGSSADLVKPAMRAAFRAGGNYAIKGLRSAMGLTREEAPDDEPFQF